LKQVARYSRSGKETFKECKCNDCGKKFRYSALKEELGKIGADQEQSKLLGKKVRLSLPSGRTLSVEVEGVFATAKVNAGTSSEVLAEDQFIVRVPAGKLTAKHPVLVLDHGNMPIGILWAGGQDKQGNLNGIVQPIARWKL
jgi:hypothetical protein